MSAPVTRRLVTEGSGDSRYNRELLVTEAQVRNPLQISPFTMRVRTVDTWFQYSREAPGGKFQREDGALKVPEKYAGSPQDPTLLTRWIAAVTAARAQWAKENFHRRPVTATTSGYAGGNSKIATSMYLTDNIAWHVGYVDGLWPIDQGFDFKNGNVVYNQGLTAIYGERDATVVGYGDASGTQHPIFSTPYRTYRETAIFTDGTIRGFTKGEGLLYKSMGRGDGGYAQWRYAEACAAEISADVSEGGTDIPVKQADGVDWAWFDANGLTPPAGVMSRRFRPGMQVYVTQGQNPGDAHERMEVMICDIVSINGVTDPNYIPPARTTGVITLSQGFKRNLKIAEEFWSFPDTNNGKAGSILHFKAQSDGGNDNYESHMIFTVDPDLMVYQPYLGNISYVVSDQNADGSGPESLTHFNATSVGGGIENVRLAGTAQAGLTFNACEGNWTKDIYWEGSNQLPTDGIGHLYDIATATIRADGVVAKGFCSEVAQVESNGRLLGKNWEIWNTHPTNPQFTLFNVLGPSTIRIDNLIWNGKGGNLVHRGLGLAQLAPVQIGGRVDINTSTFAAFSFADMAPDADIYLDMPDANGAELVTRFKGARWATPLRVPIKTSTLGGGTTQTFSNTLPLGAIRQGRITTPADITPQSNLLLQPGDGATGLSLPGKKYADVTGTSDPNSLWDGTAYDANDPYVLTSAGGFTSRHAGDLVIIQKGDTDNTSWNSIIADVSKQGLTPSRIRLSDPLPKNITSGMVLYLTGCAIPGETHALMNGATQWSTKAGSTFNLHKIMGELASPRTYATFDRVMSAVPPTDLTGVYTLELEVFERWPVSGPASETAGISDGAGGIVPPLLEVGELRVNDILSIGAAATVRMFQSHGGAAGLKGQLSVTGDVQGNTALISFLTQMAAFGWIVNNTTNSGAPAAAQPARQSSTFTTSSLAANATAQGTFALSTGFRILSVKTDRPARVRIFTTSPARTADLNRAYGTAYTPDAGVILDYQTADAAVHFFGNPYTGFNNAGTPSINNTYAVQNLDTVTSTVQVVLQWQNQEG